MTVEVVVLRDCVDPDIPAESEIESWVNAAARDLAEHASVAVRIVDEPESRRLNRRWRDRDEPTNVLSFPAELPEGLHGRLADVPLGDLVICAPLVSAEARHQGKPVAAHWAHLTVHGVLHLLGYDHGTEEQAECMEGLECKILGALGIPDPYDWAGD